MKCCAYIYADEDPIIIDWVECVQRSLTVPVGDTGNHATGEDHDNCASLGAASEAEKTVEDSGGEIGTNAKVDAALSMASCSCLSDHNEVSYSESYPVEQAPPAEEKEYHCHTCGDPAYACVLNEAVTSHRIIALFFLNIWLPRANGQSTGAAPRPLSFATILQPTLALPPYFDPPLPPFCSSNIESWFQDFEAVLELNNIGLQ
ncbi:hypothetical protein HPB51_001286 [Rhipicephalus microplus]|uniref:Uncharacterized protein n=1 Tax=Rhipicephalus microplus TaxID=6941 RepID=A0A9J6E615_RHIMP|nr:hypothetical protein HPB51_001286 [Rhipicephalus microplus]